MRSLKAASLKFAALATGLACEAQAMAVDLTVVPFDGANKSAQIKAFYEPCQGAAGNRIVTGEYNGEMARIKAMIDTNSVSWDLVEVESPELSRGCDEGLFEELDPAQSGETEDFVPDAIQSCGAGFLVWSTVLAYNADRLRSAPTSWADLWDIKKFPSKRGLRKGAKYTLEFTLMAGGVAPKGVYGVLATKEGRGRAFKKLDEVKSSIRWWGAGAQLPQCLTSSDAVMSSAHNGRTIAVQKESNLKMVWNGGIYDFGAWVIPKRAKRREGTLEFIAFSVQPQQQETYLGNIAYGPANKQAMPLLDRALLKNMPTTSENIQNQVAMDVTFWADYGKRLEQRFNAWAAG